MKWQLINTGLQPAAWNMEFDISLAEDNDDGDDWSVLRFYGWEPHAISVGRNQSMDLFDLEKLQQAGLDIVRRPTGGKAILHAHELTYSVVTPLAHRSLRDMYSLINLGLLEGLHLLGIPAELTDESINYAGLYRHSVSIPCFATSAKNEIQYQGKKIIGSAQRRYGTNVLQHGSFVLDAGHLDIVNFLSPAVETSKERIRAELDRHTIDAQSILRRTVSFDEAADCLRHGCESAWGIQFDSTEAPASQIEHIPQI